MTGGLTDTAESGCSKQAHAAAILVERPEQACPVCGRPRCTSKSKSRPGERCRQHPVPGGKTCRFHGSGTEAAREAGQERLREEAAAKLLASQVWNVDADPVDSPVVELQLLAGQLRQALNVLGVRMNSAVVCPTCHRGAEPLDGPTGRAWSTLVREQRQLLEAMERLGLAEREVVLEERRGALVGAAFRGALAVAAEVLPVEVRDLMAREFLTLIGRPPAELEGGDAE